MQAPGGGRFHGGHNVRRSSRLQGPGGRRVNVHERFGWPRCVAQQRVSQQAQRSERAVLQRLLWCSRQLRRAAAVPLEGLQQRLPQHRDKAAAVRLEGLVRGCCSCGCSCGRGTATHVRPPAQTGRFSVSPRGATGRASSAAMPGGRKRHSSPTSLAGEAGMRRRGRVAPAAAAADDDAEEEELAPAPPPPPPRPPLPPPPPPAWSAASSAQRSSAWEAPAEHAAKNDARSAPERANQSARCCWCAAEHAGPRDSDSEATRSPM